MSGMVFPQSPAPEKPAPASDNNSAKKPEKTSASEFDSVSRQEQKRLDRQVAAKRQERADQEAANREEDRAQASEVAAERSSAPSRADANAEDRLAKGEAESPTEEVDADASEVFTFADLQALISQGGPDGDLGQGRQPGELFRPLPGQSTSVAMNGLQRPVANSSGQALPGQTVSQLMEAMAGQGNSETGKVADLGAALTSPRTAAATDLNSPLTQPLQASQKTGDPAMALRGYATSIDVPVGHAEWGDKLVGKLTWLTARNMSVAEIHLTPPDMGPLDVRVQVQHDQASVTVHSANPAVRDQLEQHSHRLRDMLGEQGIDLDRFDVADSRHDQTGQQGSGADDTATRAGQGDGDPVNGDDLVVDSGVLDLSWKGEVDLYA